MNSLIKTAIVIGLFASGIKMVAQQKPASSFISEISFESINKIALSDYFYNNGGKIYYKIVNDKNSLGVIIRIDKEALHEVFLRGLEIWINPGNKKKKINGTKFPIPEFPDIKPNEKRGDIGNAEIKLRASEMQITGFGTEQVRIIPSDNNVDIHGAIDFDDKNMVIYQIIFPFEKLKKAIDLNRSFSILINLGAMEGPENNLASGHKPTRPGMGDGQMPPPPSNDRPLGGDPKMTFGNKDNFPGNKIHNLDIMVRDIFILKK